MAEPTKVQDKGVWIVKAPDSDSPCKTEAAADDLLAALKSGGRYRFTVEATLGSSEDSQVVAVEAA